ncbi:MAG TPA: DMT family transporter [Verrucomicrobiae bacterium]|nr:DMT family transporter [Verrucomicrobiae bacterium]
MVAALFTTLLFAVSAICGHRSSKQIGGAEANLWRICLAAFFLGLWANTFGTGLAGDAFPLFLLSGFLGVGIGDTGYFQALPRLGSRRTVLLVQCFTPPFAALIEWLWLGTRLNLPEMVCIALILLGVAIALAPGDHLTISTREMSLGVTFCLFAAACGAVGTVMSRKAFAVAHEAGQFPDPGTTGYQRVLGGILVPAVILIVVKWRSARAHGGVFEEKTRHISREKWGRIWPWVLGNSLAGQTLGMSCFQLAIEKTPSAIVTAIVALTPVILLPMTRIFEGEKIGLRSLVGALIAVAGVIGLTFWH